MMSNTYDDFESLITQISCIIQTCNITEKDFTTTSNSVLNNYVNNDDNSFVNKMINDIIRTIYYNFEFILRFSIFGGKIPLLHKIINNNKNSEMEIPIFIQSNFQNAYVLNIDSGVIINIGYYKKGEELISIGADCASTSTFSGINISSRSLY